MTNIRVGMGYDVHRLDENLPFLLGGINIEYTKGIVAHSDGDIVFHALSDALLGAAGLGDIGHFFPDTDMKYKNIDSSVIILDVVIAKRIALFRPKKAPFTNEKCNCRSSKYMIVSE